MSIVPAWPRCCKSSAICSRKKSIYLPAEWSVSESVRLFRLVPRSQPWLIPATGSTWRTRLNLRASLKGDTGRIDEAVVDSRAALDLVLSVGMESAAGRPNQLAFKKEMASIYNNMGKWLQLGGKLASAEETYRKGMGFLDQMEIEAPGMPETRESLALCQAVLGELLRATKRNEGAEALFKQAIDRLERLALEYPSVPRYKKHLCTFYVVLSTLYWSMDRFRGIDRGKTKGRDVRSPLPVNQQVHLNNLAWYLVTVPDLATRNVAKGLELAEQSCKALPPDVGKLEYAGRGSLPQS